MLIKKGEFFMSYTFILYPSGLFLLSFLIVSYVMDKSSGQKMEESSSSKIELKVKVGDKAPEFSAKTYDGKFISLKDYFGLKIIVLYFYPKDDTPGCTKEACSFRDNLGRLNDANTVVVGVSVDDFDSHKKFKEKYGLNFYLVSDVNYEIVKKYGVQREGKDNKLSANRITFLIDKKGIIRHIWAPVKVDGHTDEVLSKIKELKL